MFARGLGPSKQTAVASFGYCSCLPRPSSWGCRKSMFDRNAMRCDGTLNAVEVVESLHCDGLYPDDEQLKSAMSALRLNYPLPYNCMPKLVRRLTKEGVDRGIMTVPFAERGITMDQLRRLRKHVVETGWLAKMCRDFDDRNAAEKHERIPPRWKLDLYGLTHFFIQPVTGSDSNLRRHVPWSLYVALGIPLSHYDCSYSELVNPEGVTVHLYVCHYWGHVFHLTVEALDNYISRSVQVAPTESEGIAVWICAFALNQHNVKSELGVEPHQAPFNVALAKASIGVILMMDCSAEPLKRIWCLFEVSRAHELKKSFSVVDSKGARGDGRPSSLLEEETTTLAETIAEVSAFKASSSCRDDKLSILYTIMDPARRARFSGFPGFKATLDGPRPSYGAVDDADFSEFNDQLKRLLGTPLLRSRVEAGAASSALQWIEMGADCDVVMLETLANRQVDLGCKLTTVFWDFRGRVELTYIMSFRGQFEQLRFLLAKGVTHACRLELVGPSTHMATKHSGSTPLHAAVAKGNAKCVSILLEYGAEINAKSDKGFTPLHWTGAISPDCVEKAVLLCDSRADVKILTSALMSPLHVAAFWGNDRVATVMIDRNCPVNICDEDGATPLHSASLWGHPSMVKLLLERRAYITARKLDGATPLHRAASRNQLEAADLLLAHHADPTCVCNDNQTPLHLAISHTYSEMSLLIQKHLERRSSETSEYCIVDSI
eukprot:TRINITY_DN8301_c0_g3_i1.p1 TRINITY_DN8301_c0_g3~~TRINITY_DN8301_c0_g3_i1.p1  ORF type:complete len:719 (+),score=56.55 TRINITY_DN8301_c0_g3_i1:59-2215(+)